MIQADAIDETVEFIRRYLDARKPPANLAGKLPEGERDEVLASPAPATAETASAPVGGNVTG